MTLLRLVRDFLRPYRGLIVGLVLLQLVGTMASLYLPSLNGQIIDEGVAKGDTGYILRAGGAMLAVSLVQIAATICATYLAARAAAGLGRDLRGAVFSRVGEFSAQEVSRFGAPTLISRNTNDVTQVQQVVFMAAAVMVSAPIMMVGGVIMALREDVGLSWLVAVAVPLLALCVGLVIRRMVPQFRLMQESVDWVNRVLREQITGIRVVRAFVREDHERERFAEANTQYTGTALAGRAVSCRWRSRSSCSSSTPRPWPCCGSAPTASRPVRCRSATLTAFMAYLMQILMSVMMATFMSMMIPRATVSAGRIGEVLETDSTVRPPVSPVALPPGATVEFRDVEFTYPMADAPVLHGVSFTAEPGQTTAIIGSTGSGKSTLLSLIPRLYDATSGTVAIVGRRRARRRARGRLVPHRAGPAEAVPLHRHRRQQPALRRREPPPTRTCGTRCGSPRPRTSSGPCPAGWRPRSPRAAPTSPAVSASASPSRGPSSRSPRSSSSTTPSPPSTSPPTRACARPCAR